MNTISLSVTSAVIIHLVGAISPHGPGSLGKREFSVSLTEAIESLGWQLEVYLHVLIHHVACLALGGDESFIGVS